MIPAARKAMSASVAAFAQKLPRDSSLRRADPPKLRVLELAVGLPAFALVAVLTATHWHLVKSEAVAILPWIALVALVDLMPLRYEGHLLTMSIAVLLAVGM